MAPPMARRPCLGEMAASDSRITLVSLGSNQGASAARNAGIERATGNYVFFLDSDDRVPPGALDLLLSAATATGSPLTIGKLLWFRTEEESVLPVKNAPGEPMVTTNIRESAYLQSSTWLSLLQPLQQGYCSSGIASATTPT